MRLTRIDRSALEEYPWLTGTDECFYFHEYVPYRHWRDHGQPKPPWCGQFMDLKSKSPQDRRRKNIAIERYGSMLASAITSPQRLEQTTFIPVPPSKAKDHPEYDNRLIRVLQAFSEATELKVDYRELVLSTQSREARHVSGEYREPDSLVKTYKIHDDKKPIGSNGIIVFDDTTSTGASFAAMKQVLTAHFGDIYITGVFLARTVHPIYDDV